MKRRRVLQSLAAIPAMTLSAQPSRIAKMPIQLHTGMHVKLQEEKQFLDDFRNVFLPLVRKSPGFIDAKIMKFRQANVGKSPEHFNYRLVQIFESEELREQWTQSEGHKTGWHKAIESHLQTPFVAYLYDLQAEAKSTR